jgi:O-antigen ligase
MRKLRSSGSLAHSAREAWVAFSSLGALCWLLLWVGINTGPWNLRLDLVEASWTGLFNGVRAALPLLVFVLWIAHLALRRQSRTRTLTLPEALWIYYGLVMLAASVYADPWFDYAYWGVAYLSAFAAIEMYMRKSAMYKRAGELNLMSWLCGASVLAMLVWIARGQLLAPTSMGVSGYGVLDRMPTVAGMPMVRASGISRLAAVPAIAAFPSLWRTRSVARLFWASVCGSSAYLVWVMQSRGSLVCFVAALAFVTLLLSGTARRSWIGALALMVISLALGFVPADVIHHVWLFATRGVEGQELLSMSGRTRIYHNAWQAIKAAPLIGAGPQADRRISSIGNAQNGVLYALLCAGFLGGSGYVAGLAVSCLTLLRIAWRRHWLDPAERITFARIAGIMAFFTLRAYPENCSALFSIDLLLQLPAIVYLGELDRRMVRASAAQRARTSPNAVCAIPISRAARVSGHWVVGRKCS